MSQSRPRYRGLAESETAVVRGNLAGSEDLEPLGFETRGDSRKKNAVLERPAAEGHAGEPGLFRNGGGGIRKSVRETVVEQGGDRRHVASPLNSLDDIPDHVVGRPT